MASKPKKGYVLPKDTCEHLAEHVKLEKVVSIGNIAYLHKTRKKSTIQMKSVVSVTPTKKFGSALAVAGTTAADLSISTWLITR